MSAIPEKWPMERAGLEPATPSLQIRLIGRLSGSGMVRRERTSRSVPRSGPALVGVRRRDLTQI